MTTTPATPVGANRKRRVLALALVLLVGVAVAGVVYWRSRTAEIPPIRTEGLDAEVVTAINRARTDVEAKPRSPATWGRLGMVLFAQDLYDDCIAIFAEAERLDPKDVRWPYYRGLALILHHPDEGIAALRRAQELAPGDLGVTLRLAEEYFKLDRIEEADALFSELLADFPDNPRALLGRGQVLSRRNQWQEALGPLQTAAQHPTCRRTARVALAETYLRLGNSAAADVERRRAAEVAADVPWPDPILAAVKDLRTGLQPRIDQALYLRDTGQLQEAAAVMADVLRDHPESDEAHLTMAKVLIRGNVMPEAARELRRALDLNPDLVDGHFLLAGTQMVQADYTGAERSYDRALELKPTHALAHYGLGECRRKLGQRAKAMDSFRAAIRYRPDLAAAHLELGALLLEDGKLDEAISHLDDAVRLESGNERARKLLETARAKKSG